MVSSYKQFLLVTAEKLLGLYVYKWRVLAVNHIVDPWNHSEVYLDEILSLFSQAYYFSNIYHVKSLLSEDLKLRYMYKFYI